MKIEPDGVRRRPVVNHRGALIELVLELERAVRADRERPPVGGVTARAREHWTLRPRRECVGDRPLRGVLPHPADRSTGASLIHTVFGVEYSHMQYLHVDGTIDHAPLE